MESSSLIRPAQRASFAALGMILLATSSASFSAAADTEVLDTIPVEPLAVTAEPVTRTDDGYVPVMDEIIVTAQRREERIQDVPVSVTVFSAEQLDALGVKTTKDLGRITPGLQFTDMSGANMIYLRGVGTDSFIPSADPSVATYVDGLYIPSQLGLVTGFGDVERVEILKGPQGTLFGRNATAGAINVVAKTPGQGTEISTSAEFGNFNTRTLQAYASFPIADTLAMSISGIYHEADSYFRYSSEPLGLLEMPPESPMRPDLNEGAKLKIRWSPTDDLDIVLGGYRVVQSGASSTVSELSDPSILSTALGIKAGQTDYEIHRNEQVVGKVNTTAAFNNIQWRLPRFDLKLLAGYQKIVTDDGYIDFDFSRKDILLFDSPNSPSRLITGELQIVSNRESWLSDRFKWIGGLYYLDSLAGFDPIHAQFFGGGLPVLPGLGLLTPEQIAQINGLLPFPIGLDAYIYGMLQTYSYSGYFQGTWNFTERLALTLGGRYQDESRFLTKQSVVGALPAPSEAQIPLFQFHAPKVWQDSFSQKASLEFKISENLLSFLSYSKGFKSGTYNPANLLSPPGFIQPEEVQAYEWGLKSTFFDGALRFNGAIFQNDIKNPQTSFIAFFHSGSITLENAGQARSRGVEFDAVALPFRTADRGLSITASASYIHAVFTDYQNASGFNETTGLFFSKTGDFTGNKVARTPAVTGNLGISQTIPLWRGELEIGVDTYYNSGFYFTSQNLDASRQKAYSLLNARIGYLYRPWHLRLTAFGINLDDETYDYGSITEDFGTAHTLAPPRTYGLRLNWEL